MFAHHCARRFNSKIAYEPLIRGPTRRYDELPSSRQERGNTELRWPGHCLTLSLARLGKIWGIGARARVASLRVGFSLVLRIFGPIAEIQPYAACWSVWESFAGDGLSSYQRTCRRGGRKDANPCATPILANEVPPHLTVSDTYVIKSTMFLRWLPGATCILNRLE